MRYYLLTMSSLTNASRAQKVLYDAGVAAAVVKTPASLSPRGCSNSVKINGTQYIQAKNALSKAGVSSVRTLGSNDGMHYSEIRQWL